MSITNDRSCIVFHKWDTTDSFQEIGTFSRFVPYCIYVKYFSENDIVPAHYSHTMEILLCEDLEGTVFIRDQNYSLSGRQVFLIPPNTVHSNNILACDGKLYCFQVSFTDLSHYVNIPNYLKLFGCELERLSCECPDYDTALLYIKTLMEHDGNLGACLPIILEFFHFLSRYTEEPMAAAPPTLQFDNSKIQCLINWTQKNFANKITLEEASRVAGYSKSHFCALFKELTGMSYIHYLNTVRISHACLFLRNGRSIQDSCYSSGFDNMSYFIQVFKRIQNVTPSQYALQMIPEAM